MARPKKEISAEQVEKLAALGCKISEMADFFGCSRDTLERRFAAEIQKGRENLKISLRQKQIEVAMGGNHTMLIWLGKNLLDQTDKVESKNQTELSGPNGGPIQTEPAEFNHDEYSRLFGEISGVFGTHDSPEPVDS